jgi:tRNA (guanine10-N2)-dimethyltransferase
MICKYYDIGYTECMYLCVLGRQPEISLAELKAVFGEKNVETHGELSILNIDNEINARSFERLGGTIKLAEIVSDDWNKIINLLPSEGKVTIGLSAYNTELDVRTITKIAKEIKKLRKNVRFVPNTKPELSSATVFHNKLTTKPNRYEFILSEINGEKILARTLYVQNINSYAARDFDRPKRDAKVGMLPPKLAQIMLNLAVSDSPNRYTLRPNGANAEPATVPVVLDPFCGTGVVLQEAALMGFNVYGTDIEERMIDFSTTNLKWLSARFHINFFDKLEVGDSTNFQWQPVMKFVVSEIYLGKPLLIEPTTTVLKSNLKHCNNMLEDFLNNLSPQIDEQVRICLAVPAWFVGGKTFRLPIIRQLADFGYELQVTSPKPLIYRREDQIVGRELLVLKKTTDTAKMNDEKIAVNDELEQSKAGQKAKKPPSLDSFSYL